MTRAATRKRAIEQSAEEPHNRSRVNDGSDTRVRVPHDEDLVWFFQRSEAECGLSSSFEPLREAARGGWVQGDPNRRVNDKKHRWARPSDRAGKSIRAGAVQRHRELRARFLVLPKRVQDVLWLTYGGHVWPVQTSRPLGALAGVALRTRAAQRLLEGRTELARCEHWTIVACRVRVKGRRGAKVVKPGKPQWGMVPVEQTSAPDKGRLLLALCARDRSEIASVRTEAEGMLAAALEAWWATDTRK